MLDYLADHAEVPNFVPGAGGGGMGGRQDLALMNLRITDGRGRGIQQSELRWKSIKDDPTALIEIPAGLWEISVDVIAGGYAPIAVDPVDAVVQILVENHDGSILVLLEETIQLSVGSKRTHTTRFHFLPGSDLVGDNLYRVTARIANTLPGGGNDKTVNDTEANDRLNARVLVTRCTNVILPNGLTSDEFCQKGLPFNHYWFECNDWLETCSECSAVDFDDTFIVPGTFCVSGMYDNADTCWSAEIEDEYDTFGDDIIRLYGDGTHIWNRSLHVDPPTVFPQDEDTTLLYGSPHDVEESGIMIIPGPRLMRVRIADLCELLSPPTGTPLVDFEVYIDQVVGPKGKPVELTNWSGAWEVPNHGQDIEISLTDAEAFGYYANTSPIRVRIRNTFPDYTSKAYKTSATITEPGSKNGGLTREGTIFYQLDTQDQNRLSDPLGRSPVFTLAIPVDLAGSAYDLYFRPSPSSSTMARNTQMVVYESRGGLIGTGIEFEGGLAFALDDLNPANGPFAVRIQNPKEPILGTVYFCSADANDCFDYNPMQDLCGAECSEEGYRCCIDFDTQVATCANVMSDLDNCGGCGIACEWDQICLNGTCVRGSGQSCWDTECPDKMRCCEDWGCGEFEISCKAVRSDPKNCGWCGFPCWDNENCIRGWCKPKHREACNKNCPEGKSCCYKRGEKKCRDLSSNRKFCGSCNTKCSQDEECVNGQCVPWYRAYNPCEEGWRNCGFGGEIICVDALNDVTNCGFCGNICPSDAWCEEGKCTAEGKVFDVTD